MAIRPPTQMKKRSLQQGALFVSGKTAELGGGLYRLGFVAFLQPIANG